ncbi:protocadherin alpha-C1-like [Engraulis encrasicolus]|uniref:protocadherin alpha-C1-like n=1 Tax=Engraulis encrasicolus TaxID=184585 RepID=UPI002FD5D4B5
MILVDIDDVPEAPVFSSALYSSQIYSISPYKFPVVAVKATDPDVGDTETLQYSLVEPSTAFAVEPSSGQVYVVSAAAEIREVTVRVKVEDRLGLHAVTTVEITVLQSDSNNVAVLTLNKAAKTVEDSIPEVETALGRALSWTIKVLSVTSNTSLFRREAASTTLVNFLAMQPGSTQPISNEQIIQRLETEGERVNQELSAVFGPGLEVGVGEGPTGGNLSADSQPTIITLGVLLGIFIVLLPITAVVTNKLAKRRQGVSLFSDDQDAVTQL